jgi:predicted aldo/keto reductase-like oxidoreductase
MGIGLQGLDRGQYFLACKTKKRDKDGARQELENSLKLLKTDHFDLYQLHHLVRVEEVKQALGPGGAMETILKAKEEGKIKYIGFSAHSTKAALEVMKGFRFDTVMFPVSFTEYFNRDFGRAVLDLANEQGAAVLAIKAMMRGAWPKGVPHERQWWYRPVEDPMELHLTWRFVLSLKGVVAGFSPAFLDLFEKAVEVARNFKEATEADVAELKRIAGTSETIFQREDGMASAGRPDEMPYPHHPYDEPGAQYA